MIQYRQCQLRAPEVIPEQMCEAFESSSRDVMRPWSHAHSKRQLLLSTDPPNRVHNRLRGCIELSDDLYLVLCSIQTGTMVEPSDPERGSDPSADPRHQSISIK